MSIWQTKDWWKMLLVTNQVEQIFNIWKIQVEKRSIGMWQYWLFILGIDLEEIWDKKIFKELEELTKTSNCLFFQIETLNYNKLQSENTVEENIYENLFKINKWYYKKFITEYTAVINLEKTEDEILSLMKPKGRYNIKVAQKKGIEVKVVEKSEKNIQKYYDLMLETTSRDNFSWHSLNYYKNFLEKIENSKLLLAYKDEEVIAGWVFVFDKEISIYYYWASTSKKEYRNMMAPYLLQWEAIKIAKNQKSKIYDFLWIAPLWVTNHSLSWVTSFKWKLTQDFREVSEGYIFIRKPFLYKLLNIFRKIKNNIKK